MKRVIGLPGDTVRLQRFVAFIRPAGQSAFRRETEIISIPYEARVEELPEGWPEGAPFSGDAGEVTLGRDQYYVLGDNRCRSSDSRLWGPLEYRRIEARVILRYWPLGSFGAL